MQQQLPPGGLGPRTIVGDTAIIANLQADIARLTRENEALRAERDAIAALNRDRAQERAALGREVLERLRHEIAIKPTLTYADAIEWVEFILARADAVERGE